MRAAWAMLIVAGSCECGWAIGLEYVDGLKHLGVLVFVALAMGASFGLLALRSLPVGAASAVWTG